MGEAVTMNFPDNWTAAEAASIAFYGYPTHGRKTRTGEDEGGSGLLDERYDHGRLLLIDALRQLDASRSYGEVLDARKRLVAIAPRVAEAGTEWLSRIQSPDRTAAIEDVLINGLRPGEAIRYATEAALRNVPRGEAVLEIGAWASILAGYIQTGRAQDQETEDRLAKALLDLCGHPEPAVRIEVVCAIGRIADRNPNAHTHLQDVAATDPDRSVAAEARDALEAL